MSELIKVLEVNNRPTVLGRDLHAFLELTERYSSWFERMLQYGFVENVDYVGCKTFNTLANQDLVNHQLTLDMAKEISMIQRNDKGKQARLYFIECEKKLQHALPKTYLEALKELVSSEEQKQMLLTENGELKSTVAILTHVNKTYTATEIAKELNLKSAIELNKILVTLKVQFKQNGTYVLYSEYANLGYTEIKQSVLDSGVIVYDRRFTQLGREFIIKLLNKAGVLNECDE